MKVRVFFGLCCVAFLAACSKSDGGGAPYDPAIAVEGLLKSDEFRSEGELTKDQFGSKVLALSPASCKQGNKGMPDELVPGLQVDHLGEFKEFGVQIRSKFRVVERSPNKLVIGQQILQSQMNHSMFTGEIYAREESLKTCTGSPGTSKVWQCDDPKLKLTPEFEAVVRSRPEFAKQTCHYSFDTTTGEQKKIEKYEHGTYLFPNGTRVPAVSSRTQFAYQEECKDADGKVTRTSRGTGFSLTIAVEGFIDLSNPEWSCYSNFARSVRLYVREDGTMRDLGNDNFLDLPKLN